MSDLHKSHRLGDLLVEAGLITAPQLREAIELQRERRLNETESHQPVEKYELGEILIELGYINRHQLKIHLSWQRRLRKTTAIMVFVAPLLTAACGGGGGGGSSGGGTDFGSPTTTQPITEPVQSSSSSTSAVIAPTVQDSSSSSSAAPVSSAASSVSSSLASSSKISSVASSAASSKSTTTSANLGPVDGPVQLYWSIPNTRENGDFLDVTEIGGYELRYKIKGELSYTNILIKDGFTDAYYFDYLKGDYQFELATFDRNGLYSEFVVINPY